MGTPDEQGGPLALDGWRMERLKRALDTVPGLLGPCRGVRLCGLPAPDDVEGALRLEGLLSLLSARGLRATTDDGGPAASRDEAAIWLGGDGAAAFAGLREAAAVLLWPGPDDAAATAALREAAASARPGWLLCRAMPDDPPQPASGLRRVFLPDPGHALWGLLDHHPRGGGGVLDLSGGRGWPAAVLSPAGGNALKRAARAALVAASPAARADRFRRRRLLEAARRWIAAHEAVATDRIGPSIFAALLGRTVVPRGGAVAAYWRRHRGDGALPSTGEDRERAAPVQADLHAGRPVAPRPQHP